MGIQSMNQHDTSKNLTIYKASAGSGKTFRLVMEYISLLLGVGKRQREPNKYREILVVTFTNKATAELRERILKELFQMSSEGGKSSMLEQIMNHQNVSPAEREILEARYRKDAHEILSEILGDYTAFRVQTIDSFFQEVVRSFIYDLGHGNPGADIELNRTEAVESALDKMLREGNLDNSVLDWINGLYEEALGDGEKYNLHREAFSLAKELLYSDHEEIFLDYPTSHISSQKAALKKKANEIEAKVEKITSDIRALLDNDEELARCSAQNGGFLSVFFKNKAADFLDKHNEGETTFFNKRIYNKVSIGEKFIIAKQNADPQSKQRLEAIYPEIYDKLSLLIETVEYHAAQYETAKILLKYIDLIPVVNSLGQSLEEYQKENNILLIDEVNGLMKEIIDGASEPFIYEKIGGRISHFMIDEFQDTSRQQWENFKPLLEESLNKDEEKEGSYLVGDVKQSIYRWRDADSSILNTKVEADFRNHVTTKVLGENWRSDKEIIKFNNDFFQDIYTESIFETISISENAKVYEENVCQNPGNISNQDGDGFIQVEILEKVEKGEDPHELVANSLQEIINEVIDDGYTPGDITILVREAKDAEKVCGFLHDFSSFAESPEEKERYSFISNEALFINSSLLIQVIATAIQYSIHNGANSTDLKLEVMVKRICPSESEKLIESIKDLTQQNLSLIDFVSQVAQFFQPIAKGEQIYLNAFHDLVIDFTDKHPATYLEFFQWWEEIKEKRCIDMGSAELNSIQVMTIHKAKGLEFPVVIIPYANWEITKNSTSDGVTRCSKSDLGEFTLPDGEPLLEHYLIPSKPTKTRLNSTLKDFYEIVKEENYMDSLNLLYVAFTRAVHRLYITCPSLTAKDNKNLVSDIIAHKLGLHPGVKKPFGTKGRKPASPKATGSGIIPLQLPDIQHSLLGAHLEVREDRFSDENTDKGILLHEMMSRALYLEDVEQTLERSHKQFDLTDEEYQSLCKTARNCIQNNSIVKDWFLSPEEKKESSPELQQRIILTESTLYTKQEHRELRPDRVILDEYADHKEATIIDYKFGEKANKHKYQVQEYMEYFAKCGYTTCGYLWYSLDEVEVVKET